MNTERPEEIVGDAPENAQTEAVEAESDTIDAAVDPDAVLAELQAKADENWERYLRASAEVENVRKRAGRDVENAHKFALERFGKELLGVKDTLEMGLAVDSASVESLLEGSNATLKLLANTMERFG